MKVTFTEHPKIQSTKFGDIITACSYKSKWDLSKYAYWLVNGSKILNVKMVTSGTYGSERIGSGYILSPLYINRFDLSKVFYQCVIFDKKTMEKEIISEATKVVKLPGETFLLSNVKCINFIEMVSD